MPVFRALLRAVPWAAVPLLILLPAARAQNDPILLRVDASKDRHPIDPRIYGVSWAETAALRDLNVPLNRHGGNATSRYNWRINADNRAGDWYFESLGYPNAAPGGFVDDFIAKSRAAGAEPMVTIPLLGWVAKLGSNRRRLASFSIAKYGPQTDCDTQGFPDAGNGISAATGKPIEGNDPNDSNVPNSPGEQMEWVRHLVAKWGAANAGGLRYYLLDNEASIWHGAHRDVQPTGVGMDDFLTKALETAALIKEVDPTAVVVGPEEWGWSGFFYSGLDQQLSPSLGYDPSRYPDRKKHGGRDYLPWLLDRFREYERQNGRRLLDLFTVHFYPQGGEYAHGGTEDLSPAMQRKRNRSTRALWDPSYLDTSWIGERVRLIPRLKEWVAGHYPGTEIGITEYNWGAENHINGATAQADILGIFGREGLDAAARWTAPPSSSPTYKAIRLFRNYDGKRSTFGDVSVSATGPNPDDTAVFAAERSTDRALTVMVVNKRLEGDTPVEIAIDGFTAGDRSEAWRLTKANAIERLPDVTNEAGRFETVLPPQSITHFIIPKSDGGGSGVPSFATTVTATPATVSPGGAATLDLTVVNSGAAFGSGIVDLEVYNASGTRAAQWFWEGQNLPTGTPRSYSKTWIAPATPGTYTVKTGVFGPDWAENPHWNDSAATVTVTAASADPARFSFESGVQGWAASEAPMTGVTVSRERAFAGTGSLAVAFGEGPAGKPQAYAGGVTVPAGATISYRIWIPEGSPITAVQPYILQGEAGGWLWTGSWQPIGSIRTGEWNTLTVRVPANVKNPLYRLGVEFTTSAPWSGTAWIDSVDWEDGAPSVTRGDLNDDGKVSVADAILALRIAVGLLAPSPRQIAAGDVNGSNTVTIADVVTILRLAVL